MKLSTFMNATGRARLLAMLITLLLAFSVVACGDDDDKKANGNNDTTDVVSDDDATEDQDTTPSDDDATDDQDTTPGDDDTTDDPDTSNPGVDTPPPDNSHLDDTNGTTCDDIFSCQQECDSNDFACGDECVDAGSERAQKERVDLLTCLDDKCAGLGSDAITACMNTYCRAISIVCFGEPDPGVCLQNCTGENDTSCRDGNVCENRGAIICMAPDGSVPANAQDCTETGVCDNPDEGCYTFTGGDPQPGAACIDNCTTDADCAGELTCEQISESVSGCFLIQGESIFIPEGAADCLENADACGDTQTCVNYGGGGNQGSGQTGCSVFPDNSVPCTTEGESCYNMQGGGTICAPHNEGASIGDSCEYADSCNAGQVCIGTCEAACDTAATTDSCTGGTTCIGVSNTSTLGACLTYNEDANIGDPCHEEGPTACNVGGDQVCLYDDATQTTASCQQLCDTTANPTTCPPAHTCQLLQGEATLGTCIAD